MTVGALVLFLLLGNACTQNTPDTKTESIQIPNNNLLVKKLKTLPLQFPNGESIIVDIVDTPETRESGLMNKTSLPTNYGMLFIFSQEAKFQFWMKNTLIDLDMIFIGKDKRITVIHTDVPRSTKSTPEPQIARRSGMAKYVLELAAGGAASYQLKAGQTLKF